MKEALKQVSSLVERFERNIEAYRSPAYNETQLRREFIDPFFEALGWDVTNKAGYAEQYKDVIHEDAIKVAGATKAPDYCFRIGGHLKASEMVRKLGDTEALVARFLGMMTSSVNRMAKPEDMTQLYGQEK
jgi:predicted type IV restriction endonuclease